MSDHEQPIAANVLDRQFAAERQAPLVTWLRRPRQALPHWQAQRHMFQVITRIGPLANVRLQPRRPS
jgi:hypothetical protein